VPITGHQVTVHFMAAVLSYSRRLFVKAFLHDARGEVDHRQQLGRLHRGADRAFRA
jgi:hypothetical protein